MSVVRRLCLALALLASSAAVAMAAENHDNILVTFVEADGGHHAPGGPPGPGYSRDDRYGASLQVRWYSRQLEKELALEKLDEWPITALTVHCVVYRPPAGADVDALLAQLRAREEVDSAQRMRFFEVSSETLAAGDPYVNVQHAFETLELDRAHSWAEGSGVAVAIIDTGADLKHPDLAGQIAMHKDFAAESKRSFSTDMHGTAVAGVIAAAAGNGIGIVGVAPRARLSLLRACWYESAPGPAICNSFTLAQALSEAIDIDADVINLSITGPADPLLERLLEAALRRGIVAVAAAPADAAAPPAFPSSVPGVIVVRSDGAGDTSDTRQFGGITAPGQDILVPIPQASFDFASGTSLAAAHVSGVVSLMLSRQPDLEPEHLVKLLRESQSTSFASVNACRALAALLGVSGCRPQLVLVRSQEVGDMNAGADRIQ